MNKRIKKKLSKRAGLKTWRSYSQWRRWLDDLNLSTLEYAKHSPEAQALIRADLVCRRMWGESLTEGCDQ